MIAELDKELEVLEQELSLPENTLEIRRKDLLVRKKELLMQFKTLSPADKVYIARHAKRPSTIEMIDALFTSFFEQKGDRFCKEDGSILGGIALYKGKPVTVIGHRKGRNLEENLKFHFGMPGPEGYRKALRLMRQAEKFGRPIITFIDTPGAYPGLEAEARGQGEAIAQNLAAMSELRVPVIAIVTGEGNSGGALAIGVANHIIMLEHAVFSILSPEGFASILWKDASRSKEACDIMKLTAQDLKAYGLVDTIIPEPLGGAHKNPPAVFKAIDGALSPLLQSMRGISGSALAEQRYTKFRAVGTANSREIR